MSSKKENQFNFCEDVEVLQKSLFHSSIEYY